MEMLMITNTTGNFVSADYHQCDLDDNHEGDEVVKKKNVHRGKRGGASVQKV